MSERILSRQEVLKLIGKPYSSELDELPKPKQSVMDSNSEMIDTYLKNLPKLLDPNYHPRFQK
jgi:hypothetical protein